MKIKFKKRFKTLEAFKKYSDIYLQVRHNKSLSITMNKSVSRNGKKIYYNVIGYYEPEPKEGK